MPPLRRKYYLFFDFTLNISLDKFECVLCSLSLIPPNLHLICKAQVAIIRFCNLAIRRAHIQK